ncbi:hypothetical protein CO674_34410 [Rhizobium hidalgonense]|uniref:Uncharacterized protein n=1 Tax=Rhizobium hidalgonense TaxID=1538159 RepID=A0ABX4JH91_9HYPH|nr:hypothetical protein CO659_30450 [Rhizobium sp. S9]PDT19205.1 hypothetical protein CO674_34410 [Rhizobium hidalgonense]PON04204.1 hypothetical protein ATY29_28200 [Rhizobium hidalgonense]
MRRLLSGDVPGTVLVAASKQSASDAGTAIDGKLDIDKLKAAIDAAGKPIFAAAPQQDLCGKVKTFWIIPLQAVKVEEGTVAVLGLSTADPSNLDQVNALEKSLAQKH